MAVGLGEGLEGAAVEGLLGLGIVTTELLRVLTGVLGKGELLGEGKARSRRAGSTGTQLISGEAGVGLAAMATGLGLALGAVGDTGGLARSRLKLTGIAAGAIRIAGGGEGGAGNGWAHH